MDCFASSGGAVNALALVAQRPELVLTVRGVGYKFAEGFKDAFNAKGIKYSVPASSLKVGGTGSVKMRSAFYDGGYTGQGGKYQVAGIVHKGEYVLPKHLVNQRTGLPHADALGRLPQGSTASPSYANGGYVGGDGMMVVDLSPRAMKLLRVIADRSGVRIGNETIGRATTAANRSSSRRGAKIG